MQCRFRKGFTLVEMLIVVAIIGILSAMILVVINNSRAVGRDSKRLNDITSTASALASYYADNHKYPSVPPGLTQLVTDKYISSIPTDPKNQPPYIYQYDALVSSSEYSLLACLEKDGGKTGTGNPLICSSGPYYKIVNGEPAS